MNRQSLIIMKKIFLFFIVASILVFSCNNEAKQTEQTDNNKDSSKPVENKVMIPTMICYSAITGKDTVFLKVEKFPNVVTGNLSYKFHEKDSNKGDIDGQLRGDTLFADYKFLSEGILSTREVVFLIKDSIATEGHGTMEEKNGKMAFKDGAAISFNGTRLKKEDCNK